MTRSRSLHAWRTRSTLRVGLAVCVALAAAAVAAVANRADAAPAASGDLTLWNWQPVGSDYSNFFSEAGNRYKQQGGGNLSINTVDFTSYFTKFKTAAAGGDVPDLIEMSWTGDYRDVVDSGGLLALDKYLPQLPKFYGPVLNSLKYKGHVYAVPMDVNTLTIGYNKAIFKKLGLKVPKTFDQLLALAKPIRKGGYQPLATMEKDKWPGGDLWFAQVAYTDPSATAIRQAEDGKIKWTDRRFVRAAENVKKLQTSGLLADGVTSLDFTSATAVFARGQSAMVYPVGNFLTSILDQGIGGRFEYGLFPFPPPKAGQKSFATGGPAIIWSIPAKAKNAAGAVELLKLMMDKTGTDQLVKKDFIPAYPADTSANSSALYKRMVSFQPTAQTRAIFIPNVYNTLLNGVQALINGKTTPVRMSQGMQRAYNASK
ncbi:MAG: extracellular solute-binding protein [Gaiellales bacterium]